MSARLALFISRNCPSLAKPEGQKGTNPKENWENRVGSNACARALWWQSSSLTVTLNQLLSVNQRSVTQLSVNWLLVQSTIVYKEITLAAVSRAPQCCLIHAELRVVGLWLGFISSYVSGFMVYTYISVVSPIWPPGSCSHAWPDNRVCEGTIGFLLPGYCLTRQHLVPKAC